MAMAKSHKEEPARDGTLVSVGRRAIKSEISDACLTRWLLDESNLSLKWKDSRGRIFVAKIDSFETVRLSTSRGVKFRFVGINGDPYMGITVDVSSRRVHVDIYV